MSIVRKIVVGAFSASLALMPLSVSAQSLTAALAAAYTYNPELESALLAIKSAAEDIAISEAGTRPTIGASLDGAYNWAISDSGTATGSSALTAGLSYNQTLFDNYRTDANIEQARALADLTEHTMRNTEQNVLLSVVEAYMNVIRDRQLVSLRSNSVNFFQAQLQSARDRLEVGEGTRIEVAQSEARLAQGRASSQSAITSLQTSEATYQRFVGSRPQSLSASHNYSAMIPRSIDSAIAEAEVNHPAILSAKAAIRVSQAGSDAAEAQFGPTLDLNGTVGTGVNVGGLQSGPQGVSGSVRLSLSVPIYAGGAIGAGVRKANIEQIRSEVDAMSAYDQIREAVIASWSGVQNADAQIQSAGAAVAAGQQVLDGVIQERDLGASTTLDVLNAQAELVAAQEGQITASTSKVIATFSLLSAMGRLNAVDLGLPVEIKSAEGYTQQVEDVWQELRTLE